MRLAVEYEMRGERIPKDYRRGFLSLIKGALRTQGDLIFDRYMADYALKPFTFSVYFPELQGQENEMFKIGHKISLNISTCSLEFGTYLYNGFRALRSFVLFENTIGEESTVTLKRISLKHAERIRSNEVHFKTASPVLISNKGDSNWYLVPGDNGFEEGLRFAVGEIAKAFLNRTDEFPFDFITSEQNGKASWKKRIVWHYNMDRSAFIGHFTIKSDPEILQLIYDVGLGVRRSQGFGMLEVVKQ